MKLFNKFLVTTLLGLSALNAGTYKVDMSHSDVSFKVKHMMISTVRGNFEQFSGSYELNEKTKTFSSLEGVVQINSLTTREAKRDGHLKSPDFFDVKKYPTMKLKLIKQTKNRAVIALTIKDVTKNITMELDEISGSVVDAWKNTRTAFELRGEINRQDFNMKFNQMMGAGDLMVDNKVNIEILIEGIQVKK